MNFNTEASSSDTIDNDASPIESDLDFPDVSQLSYYAANLPPSPPESDEGSELCSFRNSPIDLRQSSGLGRDSGKSNWKSVTLSEALFASPMPSEGVLLLTDEEKNTLIAEGYPIPTKLPLTKNEEKYLKKIRRKIKNKISAQESRRKKKEYMDSLERKMHLFSQENTELQKKVDILESSNRSLLSQLKKLQSMVKGSGSATPGGSCLMVLVLFFAAFLGTWSPMTWNIGYSRILTSPIGDANGNDVGVMSGAPPMGPFVQDPVIGSYIPSKGRSRLLYATEEEEEENQRTKECYGPSVPVGYRYLLNWFSSSSSGYRDSSATRPQLPRAETFLSGAEAAGETVDLQIYPSTAVYPNVYTNYSARVKSRQL